MVSIQNLHKKFGKNQVLSGLDLEISEGGIFAVLGPNGSGKTTLIKCLLGMVIPNKGSISVMGENVKNGSAYRHKIDYLPQIANFPSNLKVKELIKMIKDLRGNTTLDQELISLFKLEPFLDKKLGNLSGGTKQKVNLVLTFMFNSPLVILDEPTSGLDPISLLRLKKLIQAEKDKGKTILITSHIMSFVEEISDEIVFLLEGKIYFKGSINELKNKTNQPDFEHAIASILTDNHA
ncbi:MAG: ABC transporter ATP-binding protein [Xanthomarina sp.]|jgi:Cu-processing system ATP-binding protein|uniref:ABC transporter ATP-binding protein n=1 Tax=Xanthomarina gelatinilytica TaxID=1137281 RepID=M7N605_9FLAO|nr:MULTISPECIES: ABC transporter ATP-binding protein [Xanthomarina]MCB0389211.1 ABC transporter ATP-binding protein [Winogradskyella sp.]EMQ93828.1 ABC-type multidrug transport system, ATPase component [Xanthomarina gelatinilytica]MAL22987.1 ABC transporter ATP-binding protein [Xanthomarina sp.]MBF62841.1 ABC transporter ATP-binding protein [Xanthomarina sp.]MDX1317146.1 ABC transporter ATP-binding protein [Xanthomarina gelatinilytica]|tara:strand:- start:199 stop:906 length:708 start_codon:yes stop_codon:yes gene_type:complete